MVIFNKMYVGIDFSKEKFNACLRRDHCLLAEDEFTNTRAGYQKLIRWVKKNSGLRDGFSCDDVLFCGEHTGSYSVGLSEYLYDKGFKMWLQNALAIKNASGIQRVKTDKADAKMIANYVERNYEDGVSVLFKPESIEVKQLRSLCNYRERTIKDRVAIGNAIQAGTYDSSPVALRQIKHRYNQAVQDEKEITKVITTLMKTSEELSENYRLLTSINGIGTVTAAWLLIYTSNFTRFDAPRKFACFCGVAPFGKQSGTSVNTTPHVSRFAHLRIKALMAEAARAAMRFNPAIREYAARLRRKGKHDGIILNNVKNKLFHIIFKIIATRQPWQEDYQQSHTSGNQNPRSLGDVAEKGAAEATPLSTMSVQPSPSVFGDDTKLEKTQKNSKLPEKSSPKICSVT